VAVCDIECYMRSPEESRRSKSIGEDGARYLNGTMRDDASRSVMRKE
jgi:hypothetical protein